MLNNIQKTVCALAVLATTSLPAFAESVDVRVIGTITPTACTPVLTGGGTIDYGAIHPNTLAKDAYTTLAEKQLDFTINCDAPAKVAVQVINYRVGTLPDAAADTANGGQPVTSVTIFGTNSNYVAGLGLHDNNKIGGYGMRFVPGTYTADSAPVVSIYRPSPTSAWVVTSTGSIFSTATRGASWAAPGTTTPIAFTTLTGKLGVQAYINKASELDLTKPIALDGLTTIEIVYL
ncbi:DUF1120 domain-containing protein [Yersinia sp. 2545 StPb PI]|uniref:DUF1120 domain-containing protein n=1 Tax=unclassified Yersinia (in: enterobacteria) TaxID=2653513 RepID=UPI003FA49E1C